jgi:hypothetical protein
MKVWLNNISVKIIAWVILALLLAVLYIGHRGSFSRRNTSFAVTDDADITLIDMRQGDRRVVLRKSKDGWLVNEAGEARGSAVSFLLQTLREIVIKSPVSEELYYSEVVETGIEPVRVRAMSGRKLLTSFLIWKTESNIYGNIAKRSQKSKPFILYIPGYEGSIGSGFTLNELFWKPYNIFSLNPGQIASVEVSYTDRPNDSFVVHNPFADELPPGMKPGIEGYDTAMVRRYISYFLWVSFENWAFDVGVEETASIVAGEPEAEITVVLADGRSEVVTIWERRIEQEGEIVVDLDRVWGRKGDGQPLFVARYFDLDPLLRKKSYFFPSE